MAILSKIFIIFCLLFTVYASNQQEPKVVAMPKQTRSNHLDDPNPIRSSQMGIAICPAENANDMRYENYSSDKLNRMNMVKDEDDGEDLDIAAGDDGEDSDDFNNTAMDEAIVDETAFATRVSCLMAALDHHIKAIVCNAKNIESQLGNLKPTGICGKTKDQEDKESPQEKTKTCKKPKHFQEMHEHNQDDSKEPFGGKLGTELPNTPTQLQVHPLNRVDISAPGNGIHFQNRGEISPPGPGTYSQNRGDFFPPGPGSHSLNRVNTTPKPVPEIDSPKISELKIIYPAPEHYNHKPYQEYENKLKRLMANRDAIEQNVYKMLAPRQGERM
ncbi:hypothetical protein KR032_007784 [Drosophila birchii]|nr:hypothetical protein KR032_007784 [Drosophila birchii]